MRLHTLRVGEVVPALARVLRELRLVRANCGTDHVAGRSADARTAPAADGRTEPGAQRGRYDRGCDRAVIGALGASRDFAIGIVLAFGVLSLELSERFPLCGHDRHG